MSQPFQDIARFEYFTDLNLFKYVSFKTGKRMLYNFIQWCLFLLAVIVERDKSSRLRMAN